MSEHPVIDGYPPPMRCAPVGDWVIVPDGRTGQVWAPHPDGRFWVAFGNGAEPFPTSDLKPATGTNYEQEGLQL